MKKIETWAIVCDNYEGDYETYYFEDFESASRSFNKLVNKYKKYDEFKQNGHLISWFEGFNEYSTYIRLVKTTIYIHDKMIEI